MAKLIGHAYLPLISKDDHTCAGYPRVIDVAQRLDVALPGRIWSLIVDVGAGVAEADAVAATFGRSIYYPVKR